jgi:hypothetical protein
MNVLLMTTTIVVALLTAVIGPIAVEWAKRRFSTHPKSDDVLQEAIEYNDTIDQQLKQIIEHLDCERVWISQFHNGGHFYPTGKSIQKFSIFHEKISPSCVYKKSIQPTFTNIPVSLFPVSLAKLKNEGEIQIINFKKDNSLGLEIFADEYEVTSLYMISLKDLNDKFIGVLHISYGTEYKLTHNEWIFLRQKVGVIGSLLTKYLHQSNNIKKR